MGSRSGVEWTTYIEKSADETVNNSTTLQDDDTFVLPVAANGVYFFECFLRYSTSAVADIKFGWTAPASATMDWGKGHVAEAALGGFHALGGAGSPTTPAQVGGTQVGAGGGAGGGYMMLLAGFIVTAGTAGNVTLQWAQNTAEVSDTKVLKGSFVRFRRTA